MPARLRASTVSTAGSSGGEARHASHHPAQAGPGHLVYLDAILSCWRQCVSASFGEKRIFLKAIFDPFSVISRKSVLHRIFSYCSEVFRTVFKIPKFQPQAEKSEFPCDFLNFFIEFRSRFDHLDCERVQYCSPYHQSSCQMW